MIGGIQSDVKKIGMVSTSGLALIAAACLLAVTGCVSDGNAASSGNDGFFSGVFGGKDKEKLDENQAEKEKQPELVMPGKLPVGTIQTVMAAEKFVLIRSTKAMRLQPGTELMTYNLSGRPTSKLSLSPEKKASFLVADIVQGTPGKGDRVVAMGMVDPGSRTTSGLIPAGRSGTGNDIQVLE